jgi:hypothetical protein
MKKNWQEKEKRDQKDFDAKPTPRSGGLWFWKGDGQSDRFLIESKKTKHQSFSVSTKLWKKVSREALLSNKIPILSISLSNAGLVVLDKNDFLELIHGADE